METLYKVLKNEKGKLISPYQKFDYSDLIGKQLICEDFDENPYEDCSNGFYATGIEGLPLSFRNLPRYEVWEVEMGGKNVNYDVFKRRWEKQTLIRKIEISEIKTIALEKERELGYKLSEVLFPVNPLEIIAPEITEKEIKMLKDWASVRDSFGGYVVSSVAASVGASIVDSVWASVRDSVADSVWNYVRDSVADSVGDSVWASVCNFVVNSTRASFYAYVSDLFPNIQQWKYINHEIGVNPFQPAIDLWKQGLVPSFDGKTWRLHAGEKAKIVFETQTF